MSVSETSEATGVVTPADIARRLDIATILLRRWFGTLVDLLVLVALLFAPIPLLTPKAYDATILIWIGLVLLYFPLTEGIWGRTLGKLVSGTIVVNKDGRPPGILKAALRTLLRLVEVNPVLLGGIPAGVVVMLTKERQRVGDILAGTYVIPYKELARTKAMSPIAQ